MEMGMGMKTSMYFSHTKWYGYGVARPGQNLKMLWGWGGDGDNKYGDGPCSSLISTFCVKMV